MEYLPIKTLYLEVTHACNQRCRHCYLNGGLHNQVCEMDTRQIIHILKEFKEQGGRYVVITGGEPPVRKDCFEILDCLEELRLPFCFASNSLALSSERLDRLAAYSYFKLFFTSLLGADAKRHAAICGKNSFDKALRAIRYFNERGKSTYVQITLANDYLKDMAEIAELLLPFQHCVMKFTPIASFGTHEKDDDLLVPSEKFPDLWDEIERLKERFPGRIDNANIQSHEQIRKMIDDYANLDFYSLSYGFLAVRPNGDMSFSCNMGNPFVFGKAYESLKIPVDDRLYEYISILRMADKNLLAQASERIIEVDATVDEFIRRYQPN